ncbi:MAG: hypothetical protein PWP15_1242 [Methanothermococcus sp.]|uniref:Sjogren's syndrome/scleroderma autoantigen 1 family protein n=1 Tax=Methanothermococcus TaxID=155862 RepID=UPI000381BA29|nr:Sjogren's syndrome/scleroderma autoantigen 1 family protein [Methanothermococcus thermolithotrophicus]MDK2790735.1 hypothetical protein [Methanothermococcus sp.]MDK2987864.1 hypothetical protein [Methanothermococcus sp.]
MSNMDVLKIASSELIKGSKMLGKHCKRCGFPLFEKGGKIYCPVCDSREGEEKITKKIEDETKAKTKSISEVSVVDNKINYLLERLDKETEINRIVEIGNALKVLIEVREKFDGN